jgi:long-chain acyl-CoA synthetase
MGDDALALDARGLVVRPAPRPIPNGPRSVADVLADGVRRHPAREALVGRHARYTYAELDRAADAAAAALASAGIGPGDRVAASLPNQSEIVVAFLGAMRVGAVWVGISTALAPPERAYMLADAGARAMLTTPAIAASLAAHRDELPDLEHVWCVDPADGRGDWPDLIARHEGHRSPAVVIDPHAPAAIAYTSGTTGFPKGAVHSQHNMLWPGADGREHDPAPDDERHGVLLPLTLLNLMILGPLFAFVKGTACVCVDRIDPLGLVGWVRDERITRMTAVPAVLHDLLTHPDVDPADLAVLRRPECGGSATPQVFRDLFRTRFGREVLTGYGLTEAPTAVCREMPGDDPLAGCSGRAFAPVEVTILDDDGRPVAPGALGEICVRARRDGPWAGVYTPFLGYWNRPEATAEALRGGVLHTDDLGLLDEQGRLFVKDRRKDLIVRGGANVYPAEVERVLHDHPAVAAAAVLGLPDERLGEIVAAAVQLRPGAEADHGALAAWCRDRLARSKVPERWAFVDSFPRTGMGKIPKRDLVDRFDATPQTRLPRP